MNNQPKFWGIYIMFLALGVCLSSPFGWGGIMVGAGVGIICAVIAIQIDGE